MATPADLRLRTETFALDVVRLCRELPNTPEALNIRNQLGRAATSVASNYRATCRARSRAEFIAKLGVVVEEADEAHMWLGMLIQLEMPGSQSAERLLHEADQLTAIFVASRRTASRSRARREP